MKTTKQLLGAVSAFALVAMSSAPALAAGTSAGTTITNNVTVNYNVGTATPAIWPGRATKFSPSSPRQAHRR
jgi:hypothetical protein